MTSDDIFAKIWSIPGPAVSGRPPRFLRCAKILVARSHYGSFMKEWGQTAASGRWLQTSGGFRLQIWRSISALKAAWLDEKRPILMDAVFMHGISKDITTEQIREALHASDILRYESEISVLTGRDGQNFGLLIVSPRECLTEHEIYTIENDQNIQSLGDYGVRVRINLSLAPTIEELTTTHNQAHTASGDTRPASRNNGAELATEEHKSLKAHVLQLEAKIEAIAEKADNKQRTLQERCSTRFKSIDDKLDHVALEADNNTKEIRGIRGKLTALAQEMQNMTRALRAIELNITGIAETIHEHPRSQHEHSAENRTSQRKTDGINERRAPTEGVNHRGDHLKENPKFKRSTMNNTPSPTHKRRQTVRYEDENDSDDNSRQQRPRPLGDSEAWELESEGGHWE